MNTQFKRLVRIPGLVTLAIASAAVAMWPPPTSKRGGPQTDVTTPYVALAYNDQGMNIMNPDYSDIMLLPPSYNLRAQVIHRGNNPDIMTADVTVRYSFPSNTHSSDKTNFWQYPQPLVGTPAPDIGLTGNGLYGTMAVTAGNDWAATRIPLTPYDDMGRENPFPLALVTVEVEGQVVAQTRVPVQTSTEISCLLCHQTPQISTAQDNLTSHDNLHGTNLLSQRPVLCASCHADNALNLPGQPGLANLSSAMHTAHAPRMSLAGLANECYACHPGVRTQAQRDVHAAAGMTCVDCHGNMLAVGDPARRPWIDLPRCDSCHTRAGFDFEQPGKLYKDSIGHSRVHCAACHGSPHAITPATMPTENLQATLLQGHPGTIDTCLVCHTVQPTQSFFHKIEH